MISSREASEQWGQGKMLSTNAIPEVKFSQLYQKLRKKNLKEENLNYEAQAQKC